MNQVTKFRYSVTRKEIVTVTITPVGVGPRVTAVENDNELENVGSDTKPKFKFAITEVPGNTHFLVLDFDFVPADPDDSLFRIDLSGSKGGSFPDVVTIRKKNKVHQPIFRFEVPA